ncbi:MAG: hypothetical protein MJ175_13445, partial [Clostridia bacterium]|nr:hypothetical protein [Clostridia bacterium]
MGTTFKDRGQRAAGNLLSYKECQDFFRTKFDISGHIAPYAENLIADAEKDLDKPYPMLNASVYMQFARNGNRSNYEAANFGRRDMLQRFFFAELAEGKGRFTDRVIDGLWHIMEESTWILPAHNATNGKYPGTPLIDAFFTAEEGDDVKHIDLFSAATGAQMALLWFYSAELLDGEVPIVRTRLLSQLKQRILHPFYTYDHDWWMGTEGNTLNNWTPWIISNVLFIIALCEDDEEKRAFGVQKSMDILDRFIAPYPDDGGCDEGPGYWGVAGASYFDCMELLA